MADDPARARVWAMRPSWHIKWRYASPIVFVHLVAALACLPWFFSWTGVVLAVLGCYAFGTLGMNIGYHRLLTHRGFSCPRWLERALAVLGACCMEESPTVWVALHRQHHHAADKERDPHCPLASFLWGHIGWLMIKSDNAEPGPSIVRYAPDLTSDPFYGWLEVGDNWIKVALLSWAVFFAAGFAVVALGGGTTEDAIRFGSSLVVWGAAVRTVAVWHLTWSVNSVTHLWGYRNYATPDNSRNNILIGLLANGEGWHNNHHADPRSARHGHSWREPDVAWLTIRALTTVGLARDVALPSPHLTAALRSRETRAGLPQFADVDVTANDAPPSAAAPSAPETAPR
jgi:stearoyl-CoA desaturase (delta-9 desaturase)